MVSQRTLAVMAVVVVVCMLVDEMTAQRNRTRPAGGRRQRNRNRGNRGRNRATTTRAGRNSTRTGSRGAGSRGAGSRGAGSRGAGRRGTATTRRRCEEIQVPMCKGLVGYSRTKLPNRFNHTTQLQVYRVLEHFWGMIDRGCSSNFRLLACSLFLPKCAGRGPGREPCAKTCRAAKKKCQRRLESFGYTWPEQFDCDALPAKRCVKKEPHRACNQDYTLCSPITLPQCQAVPYSTGMVPNMFGQCNSTEIAVEMDQFSPLLATNCSPKLGFFLCGVYMPFCTEQEALTFPCQELCTEVRGQCEAQFTRLSGGLPWPNKFQCHRYPSASNGNFTCVMPEDEVNVDLT